MEVRVKTRILQQRSHRGYTGYNPSFIFPVVSRDESSSYDIDYSHSLVGT